ncbi:Stk1 family PASTA domain-containing Ser/Thr kinase [Actinocorallia libanotica]|uniref:non-specific serine/threonine protein kinase n=1 Tax=Actinocorallia libanotica TaxID=46162 RepID=A0ABN1RA03_9ACTN
MDPLVGQVLDERYRVDAKVARGGMATVYVGHDLKLKRVIALKVMHPHLAQDDEFVRRFMGEAKSAAALSHPNVVAVYDQGSHGAHTYLTMEYLPGRTLRDLLDERGRLPVGDALEIMAPVLSALGAAHRAGLIHRDIKPENVLLSVDGQVKVADFGLARAETDSKQTKTGMIIGTVAYMAPEQVVTGRSDTRTDVYAAGILLFELLTGRQPHVGETPLQVAWRHVNEQIPLPSQLVPGVPPRIDALVVAATSKDPAGRPADADHFHALLTDPSLELPASPGHPASPDNATSVLGVPGLPSQSGSLPGGSLPRGPLPGTVPPGSLPPDGSTSVLPSVHSTLPPGGHTTVMPRAMVPEEPPQEPVMLFDRVLHFITGKFVLVTLGVIASMVIGWATWYQVSGKYDHVPKIIGMSQADAVEALQAEGIAYEISDEREYSETARKGAVASVAPGVGSKVDPGETVTLVLSRGLTPRKVPDVAGQSAEQAREALKDFVSLTEEKKPGAAAEGMALGTDPKAGTEHARDEPLVLFVSSGLAMPDLSGKSKDEAYGLLEDLKGQLNGDLPIYEQTQTDPAKEDGSILWQNPAPGTLLKPGDAVTLGVNKKESCFLSAINPFCDDGPDGQGNVQVPWMLGRAVDEAVQKLQERGFQVNVQHRLNSGRVIEQQPRPGDRVPPNTTITIHD